MPQELRQVEARGMVTSRAMARNARLSNTVMLQMWANGDREDAGIRPAPREASIALTSPGCGG
jgi:hypothetical protein